MIYVDEKTGKWNLHIVYIYLYVCRIVYIYRGIQFSTRLKIR